MMKPNLIAAAEIDRLDTWAKYSAPMCGSCVSSCCTLPVEVKIKDLVRMSNNDCYYLDRKSRLCTIYDKRPDTCRNHPKIGPRPGYCAYKPKEVERVQNSRSIEKF